MSKNLFLQPCPVRPKTLMMLKFFDENKPIQDV
jgi:hypothetical protein